MTLNTIMVIGSTLVSFLCSRGWDITGGSSQGSRHRILLLLNLKLKLLLVGLHPLTKLLILLKTLLNVFRRDLFGPLKVLLENLKPELSIRIRRSVYDLTR